MVGRFPVQARNTEPIFGEQVISFLQTFPRPLIQTPGFSIMDPYQQPAVAEITRQFYIRFYPDDRQRLFLFGINPAVAVGTDLLYAALTKAGGSLVHGRNNTVVWRIVALLGAGSVPAAALTLWWLSIHSGSTYGGKSLISGTLGIALLLTACALLFRARLQAWAERPGISAFRERHLSALTVTTGIILGVLVTISSVGAGALGSAALIFLYPRLSAVRIVGAVAGAPERAAHPAASTPSAPAAAPMIARACFTSRT